MTNFSSWKITMPLYNSSEVFVLIKLYGNTIHRAYCISRTGLDWTSKTRTGKTQTSKTRTGKKKKDVRRSLSWVRVLPVRVLLVRVLLVRVLPVRVLLVLLLLGRVLQVQSSPVQSSPRNTVCRIQSLDIKKTERDALLCLCLLLTTSSSEVSLFKRFISMHNNWPLY